MRIEGGQALNCQLVSDPDTRHPAFRRPPDFSDGRNTGTQSRALGAKRVHRHMDANNVRHTGHHLGSDQSPTQTGQVAGRCSDTCRSEEMGQSLRWEGGLSSRPESYGPPSSQKASMQQAGPCSLQ